LKRSRVGDVGAPGALGAASGKTPPARRSSSSRVTTPFLDQERGEARERALVVARGEVVARIHALDGVAVPSMLKMPRRTAMP
jgi:hypothetical protein